MTALSGIRHLHHRHSELFLLTCFCVHLTTAHSFNILWPDTVLSPSNQSQILLSLTFPWHDIPWMMLGNLVLKFHLLKHRHNPCPWTDDGGRTHVMPWTIQMQYTRIWDHPSYTHCWILPLCGNISLVHEFNSLVDMWHQVEHCLSLEHNSDVMVHWPAAPAAL